MSTVAVSCVPVRTHRHLNKFSNLLMIPLIFLACQGTFSFQSAGESTGGFLPGTTVSRDPGVLGYIVIPGLACFIMLWFIIRDREAVWSQVKQQKLLSLLALFTFCSTAWSQSPLRSAAYGTLYLIGTLFAYWIATHGPVRDIMPLIARAGVIVCLLGLPLIIFFPEYGTAHDLRSAGAWRGLFINRTGAARCLVYLVTPVLIPWGNRIRPLQLSFGLLLAVMLAMAHAVSSFLVIALYLVTLLILRLSRKIGPRLSLGFALCGIAAGSLAIGLSLAYLPDLLKALGRDPTLTGRTEIWTALMDSILKRPLLGYGYSAFWQGTEGESGQVIHATKWVFGYAHNGYIEIALQLGLVGFLLFLLTLIQAIRNAWFCFRNDSVGIADWYIGLIAITLLYNVDEATVMWPNDLPSILYILACCGLTKAVYELKQRNVPERSLA
jgi:exopolysaccharide production protein ExoQ